MLSVYAVQVRSSLSLQLKLILVAVLLVSSVAGEPGTEKTSSVGLQVSLCD